MIRAGALLASIALAGCAAAQPSAVEPAAGVPAAAAPASGEPRVPPAMQWLYGSGEGAAASIQAYHGFRDHVLAAAKARPVDSVVLAEGATLAAPRFVPCGGKPLAVVLDADETAIQNLGLEYALARRGVEYDRELHQRWQSEGVSEVAPMPGAVTALQAVRAAGVKVIFNTNRDAGQTVFHIHLHLLGGRSLGWPPG